MISFLTNKIFIHNSGLSNINKLGLGKQMYYNGRLTKYNGPRVTKRNLFRPVFVSELSRNDQSDDQNSRKAYVYLKQCRFY